MPSQSRQLAAIMFTDIVGYTALMGEDEQSAFELLKKNRQVQRPIIEEHNGRWLKEIGDGVLASFNTVSDAVYCAKAIQKTCVNEPDLKLRIGIHLGEVIFEGNDVFGDGVNIASRLEPLAPIGGILVSESVSRNIENKKGIKIKFLREVTLKNVKHSVKVYQVEVEGVDVSGTFPKTSPNRKFLNRINIGWTAIGGLVFLGLAYIFYTTSVVGNITEELDKSIAVLPFKDDSEGGDNQYFCDGMMDEILNHLQKIAELGVKSRTAVEPYRNSDLSFDTKAQELDVAFILEGAVRKYGDRFRVTTQLIEVESGNHLWSETYDGVLSDTIFVIQSNIAKKIASSLNAVITPDEEKRIDKIPTTDVITYDFILQAREEKWKHWRGDTTALMKAEILYDKVLKLDPEYARGWAHKGEIYWDRHGFTIDYFEKNYLDSVLWYCDKAIALDQETGVSYFIKGMVFHKTGNIDLAIKNYKQALVLSQYDATTLWETSWRLGYIYIFKKDIQKGLSLIKEAVKKARGSPHDYQHMLWRLGRAYMLIGAYEEAKNVFQKRIDLGAGCIDLCELYAYQGNKKATIDCAPNCCNTCNRLQSNYYFQIREFETSVKNFRKFRKLLEEQDRIQRRYLDREGFALIQLGDHKTGMKLIESQLEILEKSKKLGRPDGYDYHYAAIYASRGDNDRALKHLRDYQDKVIYPLWERIIPISYSQYDIMFENLWDNEEFQAIVRQDQEEKAVIRAQVREMESDEKFDF